MSRTCRHISESAQLRPSGPNGNQLALRRVQKVWSPPFPEIAAARGTTLLSTSDLKILLDDVPDTLEIVLRGSLPDFGWSPVVAAWRDAHEDSARALRAWRAAPGDRGVAYAAYRAAQDREDAAQDALRQTQTSRISVS
jgi:hypothetical protein